MCWRILPRPYVLKNPSAKINLSSQCGERESVCVCMGVSSWRGLARLAPTLSFFNTCECGMLHGNELFDIWMSHITYEWVMSHMDESCHIWMSYVTCEFGMLRRNESCHIWMSHVTYEWVMSHLNESYHTYEWVVSHIWMSHVTSIAHRNPTHSWAHRGDGSKLKRVTNSISTGIKIVPVETWGPRKIFLSSKMMNFQHQHIQKRELVDYQQIQYNYKS